MLFGTMSIIFSITIIIEGIICMRSEKYFNTRNALKKILPEYRKEYTFKTGILMICFGIFMMIMGCLNFIGIVLPGKIIGSCYLIIAGIIIFYDIHMRNKYSSK